MEIRKFTRGPQVTTSAMQPVTFSVLISGIAPTFTSIPGSQFDSRSFAHTSRSTFLLCKPYLTKVDSRSRRSGVVAFVYPLAVMTAEYGLISQPN